MQHILQQFQGCRHVLAESRERDVQVIAIDADVIVAGQLIELLLDIGSRQLLGTYVLKIVGGDIVTVVILMTEVETKHEIEQLVVGILLIQEGQALLNLSNGDITIEIEELRLNRLYLSILDIRHKTAYLVTIGGNWRDGRLVNLLLKGVNTLLLEDSGITIGKETAGEVDNLLLCHAGNTLRLTDMMLPTLTIDKSVHLLADAPRVVVKGSLFAQFAVIDDRGQQVIREAALLQILKFCQHQRAYLLQ